MSTPAASRITVERTAALREEARRLGFTQVGVCPAVTPTGIGRFREWLEAGYAGQMQYLADRESAYAHPEHVLAGARSVVMLALNYRTDTPAPTEPGQGRVSRYAWGAADYHDLIRERLNALADFIRHLSPGAAARGVVDTAPLLEREFAQLAGLGWIGKHTLLLNRTQGSWFFLAALLTDLDLDYDEPQATDHCGTCRACLDACPTHAFPAPYVLDATRCISYLTIELRDHVPADLRPGLGDWLFGCDICQEVCPWNRRAPVAHEQAFAPLEGMNPLELIPLFALSEEGFRARFRHTPLWRSKRRGILRNAALILGNHPTPAAFEPLIGGLNDVEPLVRAACAWALGRYPCEHAKAALTTRKSSERDPAVITEIASALAECVG